jgi:hypothetical protein
VEEDSSDQSERDDGGDGLAGVLLLLLLLSPLVTPTTKAIDVASVVVGGLGLAWLAYARTRSG